MKTRLPSSCDLVRDPQLATLLLLDIAAAVTRNALRAQHIQIQGDYFRDESEEVTSARALAYQCDLLRQFLHDYRRLVADRLRCEQLDWPF